MVSDLPAIGQLMDIYQKQGTSVLGIQPVPYSEVSKYGIVSQASTQDERLYKVRDLVEKPSTNTAPSNLAILGRYIITPEIFEILSVQDPGKNGEVQLTDALRILNEKQGMYAYEFVGKRYDVGDKIGFLKATVEIALTRNDLQKEFKEYLKGIVDEA